ncbi:hypothetical protein ACIO13_26035 [Streptomyces sp. NPDC087425]|uniref:hypothetical protein n=1 Tax=Streptomyces sp. NPDC087425 TaxID=3365787 RepID=UPI0037F2BB56
MAAAVKGPLGHVEGLVRCAFEDGVQGHGGQNVGAHLDVAASARQAQCLHEVLLGGGAVPGVERRPGRDAGQLRGVGEQLTRGCLVMPGVE